MKRKDDQATMDQHFEDKRSYVCLDGREVLYGLDWKARKRMVWERGGGKCEEKIASLGYQRCPNMMDDPHHIIPRSKGRDDRLDNLIGLCRMHHDLLDRRKPQWSKKAK